MFNYFHVYLCSLVWHAPYEGPLPDSKESTTETKVQKMVSYQSSCWELKYSWRWSLMYGMTSGRSVCFLFPSVCVLFCFFKSWHQKWEMWCNIQLCSRVHSFIKQLYYSKEFNILNVKILCAFSNDKKLKKNKQNWQILAGSGRNTLCHFLSLVYVYLSLTQVQEVHRLYRRMPCEDVSQQAIYRAAT